MRATPIVRFGSSSIGSASPTTSGSIPDEANSRSITPAWGSSERASLTVARRPISFLLYNRFDAVAAGPQSMNQSFGLRVARQRNCQVGVSRESWFGTRGNGQAANQREGHVGFCEIGVDLA